MSTKVDTEKLREAAAKFKQASLKIDSEESSLIKELRKMSYDMGKWQSPAATEFSTWMSKEVREFKKMKMLSDELAKMCLNIAKRLEAADSGAIGAGQSEVAVIRETKNTREQVSQKTAQADMQDAFADFLQALGAAALGVATSTTTRKP